MLAVALIVTMNGTYTTGDSKYPHHLTTLSESPAKDTIHPELSICIQCYSI